MQLLNEQLREVFNLEVISIRELEWRVCFKVAQSIRGLYTVYIYDGTNFRLCEYFYKNLLSLLVVLQDIM